MNNSNKYGKVIIIIGALLVIACVAYFLSAHTGNQAGTQATSTDATTETSGGNTTNSTLGNQATGGKTVVQNNTGANHSATPAVNGKIKILTFSNNTFGTSFTYPSTDSVAESDVFYSATNPQPKLNQHVVTVKLPSSQSFVVRVGLKGSCGYDSLTQFVAINGRVFYTDTSSATKRYVTSTTNLCYVIEENTAGGSTATLDTLLKSLQVSETQVVPGLFK